MFPRQARNYNFPPQLGEKAMTAPFQSDNPAVLAFGRLMEVTRQQTAAAVASAVITASGRPHSINEALEVLRDVLFAMYPAPESQAYQQWAKTKDERLQKIHS